MYVVQQNMSLINLRRHIFNNSPRTVHVRAKPSIAKVIPLCNTLYKSCNAKTSQTNNYCNPSCFSIVASLLLITIMFHTNTLYNDTAYKCILMLIYIICCREHSFFKEKRLSVPPETPFTDSQSQLQVLYPCLRDKVYHLAKLRYVATGIMRKIQTPNIL